MVKDTYTIEENVPVSTEAEHKSDRFKAVALAHMDSVYRAALHMSKNETDAADLVQETYLRAYKFFDRFQTGTNCKAWLHTILRNTFINNIRRDRKHQKVIHLSEMEERGIELLADADPEEDIFGDLLHDDVVAAVESLPAGYKTVVLLADVEGLSYKEVADRINCPIGTVMSRLYRGRRLLREKLRDYVAQYGYAVNQG